MSAISLPFSLLLKPHSSPHCERIVAFFQHLYVGLLFTVLVKDDHMLGEVGVESDLDPQPFACIVDNDLLDQHPQIDVADLTFLDDLLD